MKTIQRAATEKVNSLLWPQNKEDFREMVRKSFIAGAAFSERWISVEEELPQKDKTVLVKDSCNYFFTAHLSIYGWVNNERSEYIRNDRNITHWRPIELNS